MEQFDAGRGEGGAIFNRGDIVVNGTANFVTSTAQVGQTSNIFDASGRPHVLETPSCRIIQFLNSGWYGV